MISKHWTGTFFPGSRGSRRTYYATTRVDCEPAYLTSNRGFSCDIILSQFCKSSYLRPPCWFPYSMEQYENTTKCSVTFYLVHTTVPNYNRVTRILAHTLGGNSESFCKVNQKFQRFFVVFLYMRNIKGNQAAGQNHACIGVYHVVQTLYRLCSC